MTNNTVAISKALHSAISAAAHLVRETFAANDVGSFCLEVDVSGRTMTDADEVKVTYKVAASQYGAGVTGNSLDKVIAETLRRHGWDAVNAPLALPPAK